MIQWWRNRQEARADLAEAQAAEVASHERVDDARIKYRQALNRARKTEQINSRNHFSERLNEAFGG